MVARHHRRRHVPPRRFAGGRAIARDGAVGLIAVVATALRRADRDGSQVDLLRIHLVCPSAFSLLITAANVSWPTSSSGISAECPGSRALPCSWMLPVHAVSGIGIFRSAGSVRVERPTVSPHALRGAISVVDALTPIRPSGSSVARCRPPYAISQRAQTIRFEFMKRRVRSGVTDLPGATRGSSRRGADATHVDSVGPARSADLISYLLECDSWHLVFPISRQIRGSGASPFRRQAATLR